MRVSVGPGTPELYSELLSLDDVARCERLKHLATLGLMYLGHGQPPAKASHDAPIPAAAPSPTPAAAGLSHVVRRLRQSLDDQGAETRHQ